MLNKIIRIVMFLTSYIPLYVVLIVQYTDFKGNIIAQPFTVCLFLISAISLITFEILLIILNNKKSYISATRITNVEIIKEVNTTYLLTYIMPLIAFNFEKLQDCISFLILFVVIMCLYVKYNMVFLNPVLEIFKYTYYQYQNELGDNIILISRNPFNSIHSWYKIKYVNLGKNIFLVVNSEIQND